jgi:predicted transcriptional regulator
LGGLALIKGIAEWIGKRRDLKLIRTQIYEEMAENYDAILYRITETTCVEGFKLGTIERFQKHLDISFSIHNQHTTTNNEMFFRLREAKTIESIYNQFIALNNETEVYRILATARKTTAEFDKAICRRKLDLKLLKKVAPLAAWNHIQELLDGKRSSHEEDVNRF